MSEIKEKIYGIFWEFNDVFTTAESREDIRLYLSEIRDKYPTAVQRVYIYTKTNDIEVQKLFKSGFTSIVLPSSTKAEDQLIVDCTVTAFEKPQITDYFLIFNEENIIPLINQLRSLVKTVSFLGDDTPSVQTHTGS